MAAPGRVVEGVGYQTLAVYAGGPAPVSPLATAVPDGQGGIVLENELLRVTVLANGALGSVYDQRARREVLEGEGNQLVAYSDRPATFDAWDVDADMELSARRLQAVRPPAVLEAGPVRAAVEVVYRPEGDAGGAVLRQRYLLVAGSPRLDIRTEIQWTGRRTLIKALFPLAVRCAEATFETAYGAVTRPTHRNTSWDQARFEVPAHRWADLSEGGYGVSLLNDGRYGHSAHGNVLSLTLLRSPVYPDPFADEGPHHFTYALYPHSGDWRHGTVDEAAALNSPLLAVWTAGARPPSEGQPQLPPEEVLLAVDSPALQVGSLKLAEEGDGLVVRLYEAHGSRGKARVETGPDLPFRRAETVNVLEEEAAAVPAAGTPAAASASRVGFALTTDYKPYQILTIRLQP
ncbi:MAG: hypothetical protein IMW99_08105 [Firmicutes bacterium]|nr:hypothetical protein [Bacillota bacterium]